MLNVRITASLVLYKNEKVDVENICRLICGEIIHKLYVMYLQLIIPQYFISNKSGIWSLSLIVHSKG